MLPFFSHSTSNTSSYHVSHYFKHSKNNLANLEEYNTMYDLEETKQAIKQIKYNFRDLFKSMEKIRVDN